MVFSKDQLTLRKSAVSAVLYIYIKPFRDQEPYLTRRDLCGHTGSVPVTIFLKRFDIDIMYMQSLSGAPGC